MERIADNQNRQSFTFHHGLWLVGGLVLFILATATYGFIANEETQYPDVLQDVMYPELKPLKAFSLVDNNNNAFTLDQLQGNWTFLVFGYTHCPDICPATLSQLTNLNHVMMKTLDKATLPKFLFISVDPTRDNVKTLNEYINYFDDGFIAATGAPKNIKAFEDQFKVFHRYDTPDSDGNYAVTHSAEIFLVDPNARIVAKFTPPISTNKVARQYQELVRYLPGENNNT
jgi:protein SCO1/2